VFGFLNIDKPAGCTSRDVVNRVQRLVKPHKTGHAGTLDPLATGVLAVAIGPATRLIEYVQRLPKTYRATFLLGRSSDTEDTDGEVVELPNPSIPSITQLHAALPQFLGTIQQRPPAYSALKVAGKRSYDLARRGQAAELAPRPIEVFGLEIVRYAYPELELLVRCGSGTYVRSLGRDLAESLGTAAVMSALRREAIGPFLVSHGVPLAELTLEQVQLRLQSPLVPLSDLPHIEVTSAECARLENGQFIANRWPALQAKLDSTPPEGTEIVATSPSGRLVAILTEADANSLRPFRGFPAHGDSADVAAG
jgi:tRNA pseudouridine55 synthase